ncbi:MAG: ATP synthase F1 subunit gamma [Myxococcaceae bacterium]
MASLRDIRMRIRSVKNTQQITKAMKMVAAAKLRRAQDAIVAARPYAQTLDAMIADLATRAEGELAHPLMVSRPVKSAEIVVFSSDRGLAGGFNSNLFRRVNRFIFENEKVYGQIRLSVIGRKGNEFFRKRAGVNIRRYYEGYFSKTNHVTASEIAKELSGDFRKGDVDAVFLAYNEFYSAINIKPVVVQMLPLSLTNTTGTGNAAAAAGIDYVYEPSRDAVLEKLIPQALNIKVLRAMLESFAAFQGSQMSAMENATKNAGDMIGRLTLFYNRSRQALITKELMEIVSGAEALK